MYSVLFRSVYGKLRIFYTSVEPIFVMKQCLLAGTVLDLFFIRSSAISGRAPLKLARHIYEAFVKIQEWKTLQCRFVGCDRNDDVQKLAILIDANVFLPIYLKGCQTFAHLVIWLDPVFFRPLWTQLVLRLGALAKVQSGKQHRSAWAWGQ